MPVIRRATADDEPALLDLMQLYWAYEGITGFDPERLSPQLHRLLMEPHLGCGWIAHAGGAPAGYMLAVYIFSLEYFGLTAEIDELFVLPQYRAQGIGAELLWAAESTFIRAGCAHVSLQLARNNASARAFYRRHGYNERTGYEIIDKRLSVN